MTSFIFTVIVAIILFIIAIYLIKYLGNTGELIISICLAIAIAALTYGVYQSDGIMWAFGVILVPLLFCHVVWSYLKVSTISTTTTPEPEPAPTRESYNDVSNRWLEIVRQEADTSESYDEFKEKFLKKTNLSISAFINNELTEVKATEEGCVWKYCNFRLTLSTTTTNVYFLEEYI